MNKLALKSAMMMGAILAAIRNEPLPEITNLRFQPVHGRRNRMAGAIGIAGDKLAKRFAKGSAAKPRGY